MLGRLLAALRTRLDPGEDSRIVGTGRRILEYAYSGGHTDAAREMEAVDSTASDLIETERERR